MNCRLIPFFRLAESWNRPKAVRSSARPNGTALVPVGRFCNLEGNERCRGEDAAQQPPGKSAHEGAGIAITARRLASCRQRAARRSQPAHIAAEFCDDRSSRRGDLIAKWIAGRAAFGFWRHQIVLAVAGETRRGRPSWGGACRSTRSARPQESTLGGLFGAAPFSP
jgi:hypothetical protein